MKEKVFDKIAYYYDKLMENIDYEGWVDYFIKLCELFKVAPKKILDVGCGTGNPTRYLVERGYEVTGIDSSEKMLEVAKNKFKDKKNVKFLKMDMRRIELDEKFDAVFSFFDSMNYLLDEKDMKACFRGVYKVLKEKGTFIFDMNTYYSLKEIWDNSVTTKEVDNIFSIWRNTWDEKKRISTLHLLLKVKEGEKSNLIEEVHRERAYFPEEIENMLLRTGFRKVFFFDFKTFKDIEENTIRMVIVALK